MRVTMPKTWKNDFTVAEVEEARKIIKELKDDDTTAKWWAEIASRVITGGYLLEVLKADAVIAKNGAMSEPNRFNPESGYLDVCISFCLFDEYLGFYTGRANLTDLWELTDDNVDDIRNRMWFRHYKMEDK